MQDKTVLRAIESKYQSLSVLMDERMRRQWAAAEARAYGWGGVRAVSGVIGMSPNTIRKGLEELALRDENPDEPVEAALRRKGGGRKRRTESDPTLLDALESLVEPTMRGRSRVGVALDLQEHIIVGTGAHAPAAYGQCSNGGPPAQRIGLQPAEQPQDP